MKRIRHRLWNWCRAFVVVAFLIGCTPTWTNQPVQHPLTDDATAETFTEEEEQSSTEETSNEGIVIGAVIGGVVLFLVGAMTATRP